MKAIVFFSLAGLLIGAAIWGDAARGIRAIDLAVAGGCFAYGLKTSEEK